MVWRSAIGALAVVAVMAAVAAALPERSVGTAPSAAKEPPFGQLTKPQFTSPGYGSLTSGAGAEQAAERSDLLKLASYAVPPARRPVPSITPSTEPSASASPSTSSRDVSLATTVSTTAATLALVPASSDAQAADVRVAPTNDVPVAPTKMSPPKADTKLRIAAAEATSPSSGTPGAGASRLNINKAPANALDHLPGAGRIGQAIVRRRPYRTVDDLIHKRVLRASLFNRIRSSITVE